MAPANVWRGYDQAGLDHQYNSRGTVPDASVYLREYAARTRDAKAKLACSENLPYGVGADEVLDIYPAAQPGAAVVVFLHGGDWRTLSKEDGGFAAPAFVGEGAMFVAINFSLVPAATLPAMGVQVRRALLWRKPGTQCPMLVAVGQNETDDYRRQSREVADYRRTQGNAVDLFELKGRNHFDAVLEWADSSSDVFGANQALLQL